MKRALLIGSPYGGLLATKNDVEAMSNTLQTHGFDVENIKTLCDKSATRSNILEAWKYLISKTSQDDVVVIYYSGHGGLAQTQAASRDIKDPWRMQFIVPYDYDPTLETWRGIFDGELSQLLSESTAKSHNVTYILDCCHSARNGRQLSEFSVRPKALSLSKSDYVSLAKHFKDLKQDSKLLERKFTTNPFAVRIAAAAADETAWEYHEIGSSPMGLLTGKLTLTIAAVGGRLPWREILLQVSALVESAYPEGNQHPRSAGLDNRIPFSMETSKSRPFLATTMRGYTLLQGGRVHGIQIGDQFSVTPFESRGQQEANATQMVVTQARGFVALLRAEPTASIKNIPKATIEVNALAVLVGRQTRLPAQLQGGTDLLRPRLESSIHLRACDANEDPRVFFRRAGNSIFLHNAQGVQLSSKHLNVDSTPEAVDSLVHSLVLDAESFSQGQDLLSLESGTAKEELKVEVEVEFGLERDGVRETPKKKDGVISVVENDRLYIEVENKTKDNLFVHVFNIDVTGKVTLVSNQFEKGMEVLALDRGLVALSEFPFEGLTVIWPEEVPREQSVEESFVLVLTREEIDLRRLETWPLKYSSKSRGVLPAGRSTVIPYKIERWSYSICSSGSL